MLLKYLHMINWLKNMIVLIQRNIIFKKKKNDKNIKKLCSKNQVGIAVDLGDKNRTKIRKISNI